MAKTKHDRGLCEHWGCKSKAVVMIYPWQGKGRWDTKGYGICSVHWNYSTEVYQSKAELVAEGKAKYRWSVIA